MMAERGVRQIAVVENGQLAGVVNERDLFALQRVSMRQVNEGLHAADDRRRPEARRRGHPAADAEPAGAGRGRRAADAHHRRAQRRAVAKAHRPRPAAARPRRHRLVLARPRQRGARRADVRDGPGQRAAVRRRRRRRRRCQARAAARRSPATSMPASRRSAFRSARATSWRATPSCACRRRSGRASSSPGSAQPTPQALLNANIVFDLRPLHGNRSLADALQAWLFGYTGANPVFLRLMVQNALEVDPPLGLIRTFVVDDEGAAKGTVDLKSRGTRLFVDCARVFALALGIADPGTVARLRQAGDAAEGRRRSTSTRRSRRFTSCSCCGCGSRIGPTAAAPTGSTLTRCTRSTSGC